MLKLLYNYVSVMCQHGNSFLYVYSRVPTRHTFPASEVLWVRFVERPSIRPAGLLQGLRKSSSRGSTSLSRS